LAAHPRPDDDALAKVDVGILTLQRRGGLRDGRSGAGLGQGVGVRLQRLAPFDLRALDRLGVGHERSELLQAALVALLLGRTTSDEACGEPQADPARRTRRERAFFREKPGILHVPEVLPTRRTPDLRGGWS